MKLLIYNIFVKITILRKWFYLGMIKFAYIFDNTVDMNMMKR